MGIIKFLSNIIGTNKIITEKPLPPIFDDLGKLNTYYFNKLQLINNMYFYHYSKIIEGNIPEVVIKNLSSFKKNIPLLYTGYEDRALFNAGKYRVLTLGEYQNYIKLYTSIKNNFYIDEIQGDILPVINKLEEIITILELPTDQLIKEEVAKALKGQANEK